MDSGGKRDRFSAIGILDSIAGARVPNPVTTLRATAIHFGRVYRGSSVLGTICSTLGVWGVGDRHGYNNFLDLSLSYFRNITTNFIYQADLTITRIGFTYQTNIVTYIICAIFGIAKGTVINFAFTSIFYRGGSGSFLAGSIFVVVFLVFGFVRGKRRGVRRLHGFQFTFIF